MHVRRSWVRLFASVIIIISVACGGSDSSDGAAANENDPGAAASAASETGPDEGGPDALASLDYSAKPAIPGFQRFEGSCTTFPYNLQVPADWQVEGVGGYTLSKARAEDSQFGIRIAEDYGSLHAENMERNFASMGVVEVGSIRVGGRDVRVLGSEDRYAAHTPHGNGLLLHRLEIGSTFGRELTLQILGSLEPLEAC